MGRPAIEITPELCAKAESLAAQGLTMDQIALSLNMGRSTLYEKKVEYPEFVDAIETGQAKGVAVVANALFERSKGYSHEEEKIFCSDGVVTRVTVTKFYAPDVGAQKIYLTNRAGWSEKTELTGQGGGPIQNKITYEIVDPKESKE